MGSSNEFVINRTDGSECRVVLNRADDDIKVDGRKIFIGSVEMFQDDTFLCRVDFTAQGMRLTMPDGQVMHVRSPLDRNEIVFFDGEHFVMSGAMNVVMSVLETGTENREKLLSEIEKGCTSPIDYQRTATTIIPGTTAGDVLFDTFRKTGPGDPKLN